MRYNAWVSGILAGTVWLHGIAFANPQVRNVTVADCWPWKNMVDISYEVVGTIPADSTLMVHSTSPWVFTATDGALSGDTGQDAGLHHIFWNFDNEKNWPFYYLPLWSSNAALSVTYMPLYCVVDLSAGAKTSSYPITYLSEPPSDGFNTTEYKTTKLVLRRIQPGTFSMNWDYDYSNGSRRYHFASLSLPYYMGIFEVTQGQWEWVMGNYPSSYLRNNECPAEEISWNTIRGNTNWPASSDVAEDSFMGRLRVRTGLEFDLPTEAEWEYACRAGTTTDYNNWSDYTNAMDTLGRYYGNRYDGKGGILGIRRLDAIRRTLGDSMTCMEMCQNALPSHRVQKWRDGA